MGKPISAVGGVSSTPVQTSVGGASGAGTTQSPTQTKVGGTTGSGPTPPTGQTPSSPVQTQPKKFWPPAYGWRLSALGGERSAHNGWQQQWLKHGSAIAGGGAVDSVAELKPRLLPHLQQPNGKMHRAGRA